MIQQHLEHGHLPERPTRSPDELDQTDDSQKAAGITRAGEAKVRARAQATPHATRAPGGDGSGAAWRPMRRPHRPRPR